MELLNLAIHTYLSILGALGTTNDIEGRDLPLSTFTSPQKQPRDGDQQTQH